MTASEKYTKVFGSLESLAEQVSWTTGVNNMLEWLVWHTEHVLGITKTAYRKKIVAYCFDKEIEGEGQLEALKYVTKKYNKEVGDTERFGPYDNSVSGLVKPNEALRRAKYFSENYLNKEFDICWTLVSDDFLDSYYRQFFQVAGGGQWYTHGDSGLFGMSTGITEMAMDNLSYNPSEKLLVANELKLGGKKNDDQILKYALMYKLLLERNFIDKQTRFALLFIADTDMSGGWSELIDAEIQRSKSSKKSTVKSASKPDVISLTETMMFSSTTWAELMAFNQEYLSSLELPMQQVEKKLLWGFNDALAKKAFMQE